MAAITAFPFQRTVTIDTTASGANISSSLTDFPVCVVVTSTTWGSDASTHLFSASNTDGKRVQFYSGSTSLAYEVESYDSAGGTAVYWVKVPSIAGTATTSITVGYGADPNGSDQSNGTAVWDSSFKAVYHLAGTASTGDSTTNGNTLTFTQGSNYTGLVGQSVDFDGTDDRAQANDAASLGMSGATNFTVGAFVLPDALPASGEFASIVNKYDSRSSPQAVTGYDLRLFNNSGTHRWDMTWYRTSSGATSTVSSIESLSTATASYIVGVAAGSNAFAYTNGTQMGSATVSGSLQYSAALAKKLNIANFGFWTPSGADLGRYFNGKIGEVRISQTNRSAAWVKAEYFSMKETNWPGDGWISYGTESRNVRPYVLNRQQAVTRAATF